MTYEFFAHLCGELQLSQEIEKIQFSCKQV